MFATVLLYLIVAFVIFFTFLGIKRMFQVFFVSGSCCDSKKGLGSLRVKTAAAAVIVRTENSSEDRAWRDFAKFCIQSL